MSNDSIVLNPGFGGDLIASDNIGGEHHQKFVMEHGDENSAIRVSNTTPLPVKLEDTGSIPVILSQHLKNSGGELTATGSFSPGAPGEYYCQPPTGSVYRIRRMIGEIRSSGTINSQNYGDQTELINGISLKIVSGSAGSWTDIIDLTADHVVKNNIDWGHYCYDVQFFVSGVGPPGDEFILFRWTFGKSGTLIRLDGNNNEALLLVLRDNITAKDHQFLLQGYIETERT
jgi:hypothetical protein